LLPPTSSQLSTVAANERHGVSTGRRIAIVGSRDYPDLDAVRRFVATLPAGTVVVSGGARGVDTVAVEAAVAHGLHTVVYTPDWRLGTASGLIRNTRIVRDADEVVAFWDGHSRGTADTVRKATRAGLPVRIVRPGTP
jgi:YspA, cpYpsA-related SLOG family